MESIKNPHHLVLEERRKLRISQVTDVDTFDEGKIVLFTEEDTVIVEGFELHIQKLDVTGGELEIDGEIVSIVYAERGGYGQKGKGFFKKMFR